VRRERHFTQFTRSFALPDSVKEDEITASLDKGVLRVTVPKAEPQPKPQPKRIPVTGA
jgi:HSP20 family protein